MTSRSTDEQAVREPEGNVTRYAGRQPRHGHRRRSRGPR